MPGRLLVVIFHIQETRFFVQAGWAKVPCDFLSRADPFSESATDAVDRCLAKDLATGNLMVVEDERGSQWPCNSQHRNQRSQPWFHVSGSDENGVTKIVIEPPAFTQWYRRASGHFPQDTASERRHPDVFVNDFAGGNQENLKPPRNPIDKFRIVPVNEQIFDWQSDSIDGLSPNHPAQKARSFNGDKRLIQRSLADGRAGCHQPIESSVRENLRLPIEVKHKRCQKPHRMVVKSGRFDERLQCVRHWFHVVVHHPGPVVSLLMCHSNAFVEAACSPYVLLQPNVCHLAIVFSA